MADTAVTLSATRFTPLKNPERFNGFTHKWTIRHTDIAFGAGATDTVTVTLGSTPTKFIIPKAIAIVRTAFAGSGGLTMKVGATDDDFAIAAVSVLSGSVLQATAGTVVAAPANSFGVAAQTLKAIFTNSVSGSPSELSAGVVDIYLTMINLDKVG